ncbi:unnamed protein product [Parascedosporium putredinis]|uniref:Uncharacterized protein n=1 Tax=Parascedosporium putredinis TaxID=1442378 RepID=A0A9P1HB11_9PEZI|nr:unnamed protein product [Parascedosporium putredinis]CAI8002278.1 unnamed protein product [Parascedosporium putredinis]
MARLSSSPRPWFYVVARVVGRDGALPLWKERLVHLCGVSATEPYGDSYYWGGDLDGEPDTLWGLEGYTHPIGFFIDHVSSEIFKREMALVDSDALLRTKQGLGSPDYDLHHYDEEAGFLKRQDDPDRHSTDSHVAVYHFWAADEAGRTRVLEALSRFATDAETSQGASGSIQSALVLKECRDLKLATLWLRVKTGDAFKALEASGLLADLLGEVKGLCEKTELHQSSSFGGHLDIKASPN